MIIIRNAKLSDLQNIVHTHSLSAMKAYNGLLSPETLQATFAPEKLANNWKVSFALKNRYPNHRKLLVAVDSEKPELGVLGVARCHIITNPSERHFFNTTMGVHQTDAKLSEIQTLYVHPDYQSHGVGRALIAQMGHFLSQQGNKKSVVVTLDGYDTSAQFYQRVGKARLVGQFEQNTAETAGATDANAAVSTFNLWLFDDISHCVLATNGVKRISHQTPDYLKTQLVTAELEKTI